MNQDNGFFWGRDRGEDILEGVTVLLSMLMALSRMGAGVFQNSPNITVKRKQSTPEVISEEEEEEH